MADKPFNLFGNFKLGGEDVPFMVIVLHDGDIVEPVFLVWVDTEKIPASRLPNRNGGLRPFREGLLGCWSFCFTVFLGVQKGLFCSLPRSLCCRCVLGGRSAVLALVRRLN